MFGGRKQEVNFDQVDTIIGQGTDIKGTIKAAGSVRVDGNVEGEVVVDGDLIVSESGSLKADVQARHVTMAGKLEGDIELSGRLEITATGKIYGQVKVAGLAVAEGGFLSGNCIMLDSKSSNGVVGKSKQPLKSS